MDLRGEEPRRALVAWEMIHRGDYLLPTIQGWPYYNKPPLFNWVLAAVFHLTGGYSIWATRLPSLFAFVILASLQYRMAKPWLGHATALWSAFFTLTTVHHLFFATVLSGELDLFYALIVFLQAMAIFHGYERQQWWRLYFFSYVLLGMGFLTKGLPSIVFQGMTLLGLAIWDKQWRWLFHRAHFAGAALGLLPVVLYFGWYEEVHGEAALYLINLLEEATQKSAGERSLLDIFTHLFTFPLQYFGDHLPWVLLIFVLPFNKLKAVIRDNALLRFSLLFILSNIWIYWLSPGTRQRYLYMFLPFLTWLLAAFYAQRERKLSPTLLIGLILGLTTARIAYNYTLLPYQQRTMNSLQLYRDIDRAALQASEGTSLRTYGIPDTLFVNPSFAGLTLLEDTIYIPQYYPYQIPLLLSEAKGEIIHYDTVPKRGQVYLTTDSILQFDDAEVFYRKEVWNEKVLRVVRFPDKSIN